MSYKIRIDETNETLPEIFATEDSACEWGLMNVPTHLDFYIDDVGDVRAEVAATLELPQAPCIVICLASYRARKAS